MGYRITGGLFYVFLLFFSLSLQAQTVDDINQQKIDSAANLSFQYITTNPKDAFLQLQEAERIADSLNYKKEQAAILSNLSLCQNYLGKLDEAAEDRIKSIRLYEELGLLYEAGKGYALLGWGTRKRNLQRGEYFMNKGIQLLTAYPNSIELSNAYNNYGMLKLELEQLDSAILFINKSLDIKIENKDTLGIAYSYGYLSAAYQELGNLDDAIRYLNRSYTLKEQMSDSSGMAVDLTNIAALYQMQDDSALAIKNYKASLKLAREVDYSELAEHNYRSLSAYFEAHSNLDSALHYQKDFFAYYQSRINESTNKRLAELEVQFDTDLKEKELALKNAALAQEQLKVEQRNWMLGALGSLLVAGIFVTGLFYRQQKIKQENQARENKLKLQLSTVEMENKIHQERERISRDLHDNVGSQISNLITGLEIGNLHLKKDQQDEAFKLFTTLDEDARSAMTVLRETIWLIDKEEVSFQHFLEHIKSYIRRQENYLGNLKTKVTSTIHTPFILTAAQSLNLTRIIKEALNNAKKYAEASCFSISFQMNENELQIEIIDDGCGMDVQACYGKGYGLENMRERAQMIDAGFELTSTPGQGVCLQLVMPIYLELGI